jgi:hypothetical protein
MNARFCALFWMVMLFFLSLALLLFACIHWRNAWSLFILLPCVLAFFVPALCLNYTPLEQLDTTNIQWDEPTMKNCRELGWILSITLLLSAYGVPILAWYNSGFPCAGAAMVQVALTALVWTYLLWLRVFGPLRVQ